MSCQPKITRASGSRPQTAQEQARLPPKARLGTLSHPVCKGAQDPGESPGLRSPFSRNQPRPAPGVGGTRRAERRGDAGLLLCGPGKRGPALGGDPTGNEHLHESHWSHPPCSRWTPTRGGQPEAVRGGGGASRGRGRRWAVRGAVGGAWVGLTAGARSCSSAGPVRVQGVT